jgi:GNAT superfamily N-acetyltransferase
MPRWWRLSISGLIAKRSEQVADLSLPSTTLSKVKPPSFRPATGGDIPILLELVKTLYAHENIPYDSDRVRLALGVLLADSALGQIWLIEADQLPIGYLVLAFVFVLEFSGRCAFVDELFIAAEHRGQGYGTCALDWIEQTCRSMGLAAIRLEVECANEGAANLYARAGFERHDRFILTKRLRKPSP